MKIVLGKPIDNIRFNLYVYINELNNVYVVSKTLCLHLKKLLFVKQKIKRRNVILHDKKLTKMRIVIQLFMVIVLENRQ